MNMLFLINTRLSALKKKKKNERKKERKERERDLDQECLQVKLSHY